MKVNKICEYCNEEFETDSWRKDKYCNRECYKKYKKEKLIKVRCLSCKEEFPIIPQRYNKSVRKEFFCCIKCRSNYYTGKNNPNYGNSPDFSNRKKGIYKRCLQCNEKFYVKKCHIKTRKFCSTDCHNKSMLNSKEPRLCIVCNEPIKTANKKFCSTTCQQEYTIGQNHPLWKDGKSFEPYPIRWKNKLKRKIRERDNHTCQLCGKTQEENKRKLSVHHIDYDKDNCNENNLICLCNSCHSSTNVDRDFWKKYFKQIKKIKKER